MSGVWGMILQWGSTIKMSIEIPVATRHCRDMTENLLKATLKSDKQQHFNNIWSFYRHNKRQCMQKIKADQNRERKILPLFFIQNTRNIQQIYMRSPILIVTLHAARERPAVPFLQGANVILKHHSLFIIEKFLWTTVPVVAYVK